MGAFLLDIATKAVAYAYDNEKRLVNHPDDPGGITNHGISLRHALQVGDLNKDGILDFDFNLDGKVTADDIKMMPKQKALDYYAYLFEKWRIDELIEPAVAIKIFDYHFPMGPGGAGRVVQRACCAVGHQVLEDGIIGSRTLSAVNNANSDQMMIALMCEGAGYFRSLRSESFEGGWLKRAYKLPHMETPS